MSPRRNIGQRPTRPRHIARVVAATGLAALALTGTLTACADAPTGPAAPRAAAAPAFSSASATISTELIGDTTVTVFVVGTNTASPATFNIGNASKIDFPFATGSICDVGTSSYGSTEWDKPCAASKTAVEVTARTWVNAEGKVATDFQPRMRFVPGLRKGVTLTLRDAAKAGTRVDFCSPAGCVDEAVADPSLAAQLNPANGFVTRLVKHFSGYTVVAN